MAKESSMTYPVLITKRPDDGYLARALALPEIAATGATEAEAIDRLRAALAEVHARSRLVHVDVPIAGEATIHPWARFAGVWAADPDWAAFERAMADYRRSGEPPA
jgi:predicted RNase H-like HicB family nuclease